MRNIFVVLFFALMLVGCDRNSSNPVTPTAASDDVAFSETSMYKTVIANDSEFVRLRCDSLAHDSLRHGKMLGTIRWFVRLSEAQMESVKVYGKTLFDALQSIRQQVLDSTITKEEARMLVQTARAQFVSSVESILTEEQIAKFEEWIVKFWNKHHGRGHGRGPGERGRHEYPDRMKP
jgi:hypothetical protein